MIRKLLIANRGEIACRIARTCRRLGIAIATVHSAADRDAMHVREIGESVAIGGAPAGESYLNIAAILQAATRVGADAVHPGIGFLSEDPNFAAAVEAQGLVFIGPRPDTMRRFADKWAAKREAQQAGVPVIGGSEGSSSDAGSVHSIIREGMRLPLVLKAAAGGGGRGVRIVRSLDGLLATIESAMREAQSSFGRPDLIVEEFVESARHLEVQVAGDGRGNAIHLFERECSLQRRFQKIIEEAPAANLPPPMRERILADAVALAKRVDYRNLGTMEFLVAADRHYFLECNPRLQVEHTVSEEVTGLDLVEIQLNIAANDRLPLSQDRVAVSGHAIQARVYAEDPAAGFLPSTGRLLLAAFPDDVRVESGVETGSDITPYYDPMIAKLIAHADDRPQALDRLRSAVASTVVLGVKTNLGFLATLLDHAVVRAGTADNRFIDRELASSIPPSPVVRETVATAAAVLLTHWSKEALTEEVGLWAGAGKLLGWQYRAGDVPAPITPAFSLAAADGRVWPIAVGGATADGLQLYVDGDAVQVRLCALAAGHMQVDIESRIVNVTFAIEEPTLLLQGPFGAVALTVVPFLSLDAAAGARSGLLRAPMMGVVVKVNVKPNDTVNAGEVLVVEESMKMELQIEAPCRGMVKMVNCAVGDMVARHQILVDIEPATAP
jgi:3-methylcrotonyl-CoA carboxylase alpha subunit